MRERKRKGGQDEGGRGSCSLVLGHFSLYENLESAFQGSWAGPVAREGGKRSSIRRIGEW